MRNRKAAVAALLLLLCAGCAVQPESPSTAAWWRDFGNGAVTGGGSVDLALLKVPACVLTVAVAAPLAALTTLARDDPQADEVHASLGNGVTQNCGPPWVATP